MSAGGQRTFDTRTVLVLAAVVALLASGITYVLTRLSEPDLPGRGAPSISPGRGPQPVAAFLGDSYTAGVGASTPALQWTTLVARKEGWGEANFGEAGSGYITKGFDKTSYLGRVQEVVDVRPDIVVVAGGQNDMGSNGDVDAGVKATLELLRDGLPRAKMYVVGPTWAQQPPPPSLVEIETAAQKAAAEVDAQFIPALDWIAGRPDLMAPDNIHPNDAGHRLIADRVVGAVNGSR